MPFVVIQLIFDKLPWHPFVSSILENTVHSELGVQSCCDSIVFITQDKDGVFLAGTYTV